LPSYDKFREEQRTGPRISEKLAGGLFANILAKSLHQDAFYLSPEARKLTIRLMVFRAIPGLLAELLGRNARGLLCGIGVGELL
jgi:hypothetical protein